MLGRQDWYHLRAHFFTQRQLNSVGLPGLVSDRKGQNEVLGRIFVGTAALQRITKGEACKHEFLFDYPPNFNTFVYFITSFGGIPFVSVTFQGLVHTDHFQTLEHEYLYRTCAIHALHTKETLWLFKKLAPSRALLLGKKSSPKAT